MWPENVGIKAIEIYFPAQYVDQTDLEKFDNVSAGKYTIGLGQKRMGFCNDREDINSLCLTVVQRLLDRHQIKLQDIGRLEVGTETIIDKSKSVKSCLMQLFEPSGNTDIEGIDTTNACYGGTAAFLNAINWVESSSWDGRFALVVCADNAIYAKGGARPTGGCGAVAMIVGPDAPIVVDRNLRSSCMRHAYDFYKPDLRSEYPVVDGKLSIQCYLSALDTCYQRYSNKVKVKKPKHQTTIDDFDAFVFHSPYCKLVQKSFARLTFVDFLNTSKTNTTTNHVDLQKFSNLKLEDTYFNKDVETHFVKSSKDYFEKKTQPSLLISSLVGNTYTASVYSGLVSYLIHRPVEELAGNKVAMFSYGSGLASTMFSVSISKDAGPNSALRKLVSKLSYVKPQLEARKRIDPAEYTEILSLREKNCHTVPYEPQGKIDSMFPGTYYLVKIDDMHRRTYKQVPNSK